jgi:hypothetical protein
VTAADNLSRNNDTLVILFDLEVDRLSFELREHRAQCHRIGAIVLFKDLQGNLPCRVAQDDRARLQVRGRVTEVDFIQAFVQIERQRLSDDGEILIVNRQRRIRGRGGDAGGDQKQERFAHSSASQERRRGTSRYCGRLPELSSTENRKQKKGKRNHGRN